MVTSFTKMVVVISLLCNALGLQQVPPNVVVNGSAIILSIYVMYPVLPESYDPSATLRQVRSRRWTQAALMTSLQRQGAFARFPRETFE